MPIQTSNGPAILFELRLRLSGRSSQAAREGELERHSPRSSGPPTSNPTAIVGPMQQSLTLTRAAHSVAGLAMLSDLRNVPSDRLPALDLARIFLRHAAAHVVP